MISEVHCTAINIGGDYSRAWYIDSYANVIIPLALDCDQKWRPHFSTNLDTIIILFIFFRFSHNHLTHNSYIIDHLFSLVCSDMPQLHTFTSDQMLLFSFLLAVVTWYTYNIRSVSKLRVDSFIIYQIKLSVWKTDNVLLPSVRC